MEREGDDEYDVDERRKKKKMSYKIILEIR